MLFWAREEFARIKEEEKSKEDPDQMLINDIGTALRFVEEDFSSALKNMQSLLAKNEITYELLWTIFPPPELLVCFAHGPMGQTQILKLVETAYERRENNTQFFGARGRVINHDGEDFGRSDLKIEINQFEGAKTLTHLPVFPLKLYPDGMKTPRGR